METAQEREERIRRLEAHRQARAEYRADTVWPTPDDSGMGVSPVELAPGRGNLNYSSGFVPVFPTALSMVGHRSVSFVRLYQTQPWVASSVNWMLTRAIRVPLKVYRREADTNSRVRVMPGEHPLATAIDHPWNGGDQARLVQALLGPILVHGNSVTEVDASTGSTIVFTPKDWRYCQPIMPWRDSVEGFKLDIDQPEFSREVSMDDLLHLAYWSPAGLIGTSPLQQLGITLGIEDAAQRYQRALFANGARPPSAITASEDFLGLDREERRQIMAQLRNDLTDLYSGPEMAGKPALLPPGLDWKPVGQSTVEAELIEQRKITRDEIAAVYGIPPPLVGILDKATYSNIAVQRELTYTDCLGPPLILLEAGINAQIVRDLLGEDDIFVEFDFGAVLRGDRLAEIDALRSGVGTALMTPNEGRAVLNLPASSDRGMDKFWMPVNNLAPVDQEDTGTVALPKIFVPEPAPANGSSEEDAASLRALIVERTYGRKVAV